jgi:membrane-associated phospholipid phosphatase
MHPASTPHTTIWHAITSLGDSALLLPLIIWIALWLAWPPPRWRDAIRWLVAVALCGGGVALSKLLFMAWGIGPPGLDYTGFSGHTALSLLVWPSLGCLLATGRPVRRQHVVAVAGGIVGACVGMSRLALKVHSASEVWMGAALGMVVAAWFLHGLVRSREESRKVPMRRIALLGGVALAIGLLCYGRVFPSQYMLKELALWMSGHSSVFTRHAAANT